MASFIRGSRSDTLLSLSSAERRRHLYLIGKTGTGKSTLLETFLKHDLATGAGVCLLDPHGDLAERLLHFIPRERVNDVVYFNPLDFEHPPPLNILDHVPRERRHLVTASLVSTFKRFWSDAWGARTEHLLRNAVAALLELPDATLLDIPPLLTDERYRERILLKVTDPIVRGFWENEYGSYSPRFREEVSAPLLNKLGAFLTTIPIRNIVGQRRNTFDLRTLMDNGGILIANLSKGHLGDDASTLLGSVLLTRLLVATISRADTPEAKRPSFYLYVDEFPTFATESTFATFLSEARKYGVSLTLAHQHGSQLSDFLRGAIFGNVGTLAAFQTSAEDADYLAKEFSPTLTREQLAGLPPHHIALRVARADESPRVFTGITLSPAPLPSPRHRNHVALRSRERFTRARALIERSF
jgi:hypothetical protein